MIYHQPLIIGKPWYIKSARLEGILIYHGTISGCDKSVRLSSVILQFPSEVDQIKATGGVSYWNIKKGWKKRVRTEREHVLSARFSWCQWKIRCPVLYNQLIFMRFGGCIQLSYKYLLTNFLGKNLGQNGHSACASRQAWHHSAGDTICDTLWLHLTIPRSSCSTRNFAQKNCEKAFYSSIGYTHQFQWRSVGCIKQGIGFFTGIKRILCWWHILLSFHPFSSNLLYIPVGYARRFDLVHFRRELKNNWAQANQFITSSSFITPHPLIVHELLGYQWN
jgi:hypothetical protein